MDGGCRFYDTPIFLIMTRSTFDLLAPYYEGIAQMTFGDTLWRAQIYYCSRVQAGESVLVIGGGTGQLLPHLPREASITYVEQSQNMVRIAARKRNDVNFQLIDIMDYQAENKYDWIISPFFLDCFDEHELVRVVNKIKNFLHSDGQWVVTDFQYNDSVGFQWLLKGMHVFFRLFTGISAKTLLPLCEQLEMADLQCAERTTFRNSTIFTAIFHPNT